MVFVRYNPNPGEAARYTAVVQVPQVPPEELFQPCASRMDSNAGVSIGALCLLLLRHCYNCTYITNVVAESSLVKSLLGSCHCRSQAPWSTGRREVSTGCLRAICRCEQHESVVPTMSAPFFTDGLGCVRRDCCLQQQQCFVTQRSFSENGTGLFSTYSSPMS